MILIANDNLCFIKVCTQQSDQNKPFKVGNTYFLQVRLTVQTYQK